MLILRKVWLYIKKHWWIPLIVVGILLLLLLTRRNSADALIGIIKQQRDSYNKERDVIDKVHVEEIKKRDRALKIYKATMDAIEHKYEEQNKQLDKRKRKEIEKLVNENSDNPEELTKRLSEATGFRVVMPK